MKHAAQNHYQVLGVDRLATAAQVRAAYRALAKKHHPDMSGAGASDAPFKRVALAYEILGDPKSRAKYDAQLDADERSASVAGAAGRAHYSWDNIAARKGSGPREGGTASRGSQQASSKSDAARGTEFDEMYDTFFGPGTKGE